LSPAGAILGLGLPGFALFLLGRGLLGWAFLAGYCAAAAVFVVELGYPIANVAFGLMISIHAISIGFLEGQWLEGSRLRIRLALGFLTLFAVWGLVYAPIVRFTERHWIMPLRLGDRVVIVNCGVSPHSVKRGDWVAYRVSGDQFAGQREDRIYVSSGLGVDAVLGVPGDVVQFSNQVFLVNGQPSASLPHMPKQGALVVPEKVWFIWPGFAITWHGVPESSISATMQQAAMVPQNEIIGRPFRSWCGRRQWP
jgi:hypothetical protein